MSSEEKRGKEREKSDEPVEFLIQGDIIKTFLPGISVNVSESGIGILSEKQLEPGQIIIFKNRTTGNDLQMAIVKWSMRIGDTFRAGLMFIN